MRLNDKTVAALVCPKGHKDALFFDDALKGFGVRVTTAGAKVFLLQYRVGGLRRRLALGEFPSNTTAQARRAAETQRGRVRAGHDPWGEQREAAQANREAEQAARAKAAEEAFTFGRLVQSWYDKALAHRRPRYAQDARKRLLAYFETWGDRPAASITRGEVVTAVDRLESERGTISARRALAYARACYGWAIKRNQLSENPFRGIAAPGKENPRDRVLNDAELGAVWRAAEALPTLCRAFLRVLILTAQRREEVAGMQWRELAPDLHQWTIPAERAKNGRVHIVHLPEAVRAILASLPRVDGAEHVFPGRRGGHISGFSRIKMLLDADVAAERQAAKIEPATLPDWRFHDFRRTAVTALASMGFAPHVCDRLLNHVTGAIQGVAAVYQRHDFAKERAIALDAWAAHVLAAAGACCDSNVVPLHA